MSLTIYLAIIVLQCILIAYIIYYSKVRLSTKLITFPLVLIIVFYGFIELSKFSGYPKSGYPEKDFVYVHHMLSQDRNYILLWTIEPIVGNKLYKIPYSRKTLQQLSVAGKSPGKMVGMFGGSNGEITLYLEQIQIQEFDKEAQTP